MLSLARTRSTCTLLIGLCLAASVTACSPGVMEETIPGSPDRDGSFVALEPDLVAHSTETMLDLIRTDMLLAGEGQFHELTWDADFSPGRAAVTVVTDRRDDGSAVVSSWTAVGSTSSDPEASVVDDLGHWAGQANPSAWQDVRVEDLVLAAEGSAHEAEARGFEATGSFHLFPPVTIHDYTVARRYLDPSTETALDSGACTYVAVTIYVDLATHEPVDGLVEQDSAVTQTTSCLDD